MRQLYFILYFIIFSFTAPAQSVVSSFTLVNSVTEQDISTINNDDTIGHPDITSDYYYINIRANASGTIGSIVFTLDGNYVNTDNAPPYALAGDYNGDYSTWEGKLGQHTLTATPYSEANGTGLAGQSFTVSFTIIAADKITDFTLVNAETDQDIMFLSEGDTINLAFLPTDKLNIRANSNVNHFGSVAFGLNNNYNFHTENAEPFALNGHINGNYNEWTPVTGNYMLVATPYYEVNGEGGVAGKSLEINFVVVNNLTISGYLKNSKILIMEVYPNPASSEITVSTPENNSATTIEIKDIYGKKFYENNFSGKSLSINLDNLQPGLYFIKLKLEENAGGQVVKFIKD